MSLTDPFGLASTGNWNLIQGSFTSDQNNDTVIFFVPKVSTNYTQLLTNPLAPSNTQQLSGLSKISDSGGRRKVKYTYPYRDGQVVVDLGRKAEEWSFDLIFFGSQYQQLFNRFISVCINTNMSGVLSHPVRGTIRGAFQDFEFSHEHSSWNTVAIRAKFIEDNTNSLAAINQTPNAQNGALRNLLNNLASAQQGIASVIAAATQVVQTPAAIVSQVTGTLTTIVGDVSTFLGTLAATFSTDAQLLGLASTASLLAVPIVSLTSGTAGGTQLAPTFQVGLTPQEQAIVTQNNAAFTTGNQITPQQAVSQANAVRTQISAAIVALTNQFSNEAYDAVIQYRSLAVALQDAVEACLSTAQATVYNYTVPYGMSLRMVAYLNGLSTDDMSNIIALNMQIVSANYIPQGTVLSLPTTVQANLAAS